MVVAVQAGETIEQTMSRLLSESEPLPIIDANSNGNPASKPNNVNPDSVSNNDTLEGTSTTEEEGQGVLNLVLLNFKVSNRMSN